MRRIVHFIPALVLLLILCTQSAFAQVRYTIKTQKVEIVGTSNIHDWTASVGKLSGISDFYVENNTITGIKSAVVDVDANSLAGSKGSIMDKKIKECFDSENYPRIKFVLSKINGVQTSGNVSTINLTGNITIKTTTIPVDFVVKATTQGNGDIEVRTSRRIKMSDFNLKPPTALLGTLKTANDVTLNIYLLLKK
ncbi:YceI family protein [Acetobacteroides hydrogenigenes]|uniref:Polyisoprenoid-binding protein YceI n=1 Tax=Acetobacteroides hydrogenigenes TaxID=979970 RepID=A0A4R2EUA0_9BACT|nr:YceI family protein [Acetobacteroides hydrogenigenes]TCN72205.1 polyisoprenoid-binding protein YceI [Acetobacteroides hydrogenigenes]